MGYSMPMREEMRYSKKQKKQKHQMPDEELMEYSDVGGLNFNPKKAKLRLKK